ncbi:hypothetical protein I551_5605 [Mycobacterium ulcerans str. Harvey]|uniref:Alpha/beta hydrolase family protein n=1 Tax=Mycobacterium ulcerans str. Harvey TaxID=1299332 RepID=A0ABN0QTK5_MYCUL|nr:hypothetical protein I551_5605 [Mycobacterium ulcerans str. Harvey]
MINRESTDEIGSDSSSPTVLDVQGPVSNRRCHSSPRAFWLLERFAPHWGRGGRPSCGAPAVLESSLRMPPAFPRPATGSALERASHRREAWGEGNRSISCTAGGRRPHLGMFIKPLVKSGHRVIAFDLPSHNESDPGALAPGRTTAIECAEAVAAIIREHGRPRCRRPLARANATVFAAAWGTTVGRLVFPAPMGEFPIYLDLFAARHGFGRRIRAGLQRRLERRIGMPLEDTNMVRWPLGPTIRRCCSSTTPMTPRLHMRRAKRLLRPARRAFDDDTGLGRLAHFRILRHSPRFVRASNSSVPHRFKHAGDPARSGLSLVVGAALSGCVNAVLMHSRRTRSGSWSRSAVTQRDVVCSAGPSSG